MIYSDKQLGITSAQLTKFQEALEKTKACLSDDTWFKQVEVDSLKSQISDLKEEIAEYERLKSGRLSLPKDCSLEELPRVLVQRRIASGMSQTDLARKLNMKPQQVQRYEATNYNSANIMRVAQISHALGMKLLGNFKVINVPRPSDKAVARPRRRLAL